MLVPPVQLAEVVDSEQEAEQDRHDPQEVKDVVSEWRIGFVVR